MRIAIGRQHLDVTQQGERGEPVVLVHSSGMGARQWRRLADSLAPTHRVLVPDLVGYGESSRVALGERVPFAIDQLGLERLVDQLGAPVHLIGHSYGGLLALLVALHRPALVRSVAAYEPVAFGVLRSLEDAEALASLPGAEATPWPDTAEALERWLEGFIAYWNGPGAWQMLPEPVRETFRRAGPKVVSEVRTLGEDRTPHDAYATLEMPVLLLGGETSTLAAERVLSALEAHIPRVTRERIAGAGHMGPLTHTAAVTTHLVAHLARGAASSSSPPPSAHS